MNPRIVVMGNKNLAVGCTAHLLGLREQVAYLEKDFTELRNDFNRYLVVMH